MAIRFGCFEAVANEATGGVRYLVTDRDGAYVGVRLRDLKEDERKDRDLCDRYVPRKHVKRLSNELRRAHKRKMITAHTPSGTKPGAAPWVVADSLAEAMKAYGVADTPPPKPSKKTTKKKTSGDQTDAT